MKTKRVLIYLSLILLVGAFASCEKFLDIEPQQSISNEAVYSTHEGVINVLNGAYERLAGPQLFAGTSVFQSDLVANSGEVNWIGTFIQYRELNWKSMDPSDGFITAKWSRSYQIIDLCNNVLNSLNVVNENQRERVEGEALFLRGIVYFELVRFYALPFVKGQANDHPGVPLVLTPTMGINDDSYPSRATVAQVYTQILADLAQAREKLVGLDTGSGANGGRATSTVAAAFQARVHMAMEEWEAAANASNHVINVFGGYNALHSTPRAAFNNDDYRSEDVFMIIQNAISNAGQANDGIATFFASLPGLGRGDVYATEAFFSRFEEGDLRAQITNNPGIGSIADVPTMFYIGVGTDAGNPMTSKWGKYDANIPVIRLAEMILTRAEANFRNNSTIGAAPLDDINAIRSRAQAGEVWMSLDLEKIRAERFRELAFEGHAIHDLRRFRGSVVAPSGSPFVGETIQWNDGRLVLPIPQREIDVNDNLVQNGAYN